MFHEQLALDGTPDRAAPNRCMVQARQVFSLCTADRLLGQSRYSEIVERAVRSLRSRFLIDDGKGGCVFSVRGYGEVVDATRDTYAHAFAILALSTAYRVLDDSTLGRTVDNLLGFLDREFGDELGGYRSHDRHEATLSRSQNPQMHLLEALLAAEEAFGSGRHALRAQRLVALFRERMFNRPLGVLPETFTDCWQHMAPVTHTLWEPGHQFEWGWLLTWYARIMGGSVPPEVATMLKRAVEFGAVPGACIVDTVTGLQRPERPTYRLWPQTEFLKAMAVQTRLTPHDIRTIDDVLRGLTETFLGGPVRGCWHDRLDRHGQPASAMIPASSLYHLTMAMTEVDRLAQRLGDPEKAARTL